MRFVQYKDVTKQCKTTVPAGTVELHVFEFCIPRPDLKNSKRSGFNFPSENSEFLYFCIFYSLLHPHTNIPKDYCYLPVFYELYNQTLGYYKYVSVRINYALQTSSCYNPEMDNFKELAKEYAGEELNNEQLEQFAKFADFLLETNKSINLTAIRDLEGVYIKHFLDSLTLLKAIPENTKNIIDIGSGAGFPGLPIAIARPDIKVTMVESIGKKVSFIEKSIELLNLSNAKAINERAEKLSLGKNFNQKFDVVTARAVTALPELIKLCIPFIHKNGIMIAMKSENKEELDMAERVLIGENLKIEKIVKINIDGLNPRNLVVISRN